MIPKHTFFQQVWSRYFERAFPRSLSFDFGCVMPVWILFTNHFMFAGSPFPIHCFSFVREWIAVALNVTSCLVPFSFFPSVCTANKCNTFCQWQWGEQELNKILWSILVGTDCSSEVNIFYEAIILKRTPSTTKLRLLLSLKKGLFSHMKCYIPAVFCMKTFSWEQDMCRVTRIYEAKWDFHCKTKVHFNFLRK